MRVLFVTFLDQLPVLGFVVVKDAIASSTRLQQERPDVNVTTRVVMCDGTDSTVYLWRSIYASGHPLFHPDSWLPDRPTSFYDPIAGSVVHPVRIVSNVPGSSRGQSESGGETRIQRASTRGGGWLRRGRVEVEECPG